MKFVSRDIKLKVSLQINPLYVHQWRRHLMIMTTNNYKNVYNQDNILQDLYNYKNNNPKDTAPKPYHYKSRKSLKKEF